MHAIHPSMNHAGATERPGNRPQIPTAQTTTTPPAGSATVTDQITLSPAAKAFLEGAGPGKSGNSPAHAARALIAENPGLAGMSFGKIVSGLNHGVDFTAAAAPTDEGSDIPAGDDVPPDGADAGSLDPLAGAPDPTAPVTDETGTPVAPVVVGDGGEETTGGTTTAEAGTGDPVLFPDAETIVDPNPEASLLESLSDAIDDANDENQDGADGVDIAT